MKVPLTVNDFLDRAELVYGDRVGIVDEPDQPARVVGRAHLAPDRPSGPGPRPPALDALGVGAGRAGRDRVAQLGPAAHVVLRRQRVRAACSCRSTSGSTPRRSPTSSSTPARRCCSSTPSSTTSLARRRRRKHRFVLGAEADDELLPLRRRARAVGRPTRTPPRRSTTRAAPRRGPRACSSRTATSGSTPPRSAGTCGVSDRDVYLHTLPMFHCNGWGMPYAVTGMGGQHIVLRKVDGAEILRRVDAHGVTLLCGAPAVRRRHPRRRGRRGTARSPARGTRPHGRRRRAAADPHHRAGRDRARLGVHPDLRPHRDVAAAHDEPAPGRVRRPLARASGPRKLGRAGAPALGVHAARRRRGRGARPRATTCSRATGSSPRPTADAHRRRLVPHRRRRLHRRRGLPHDLRPQEGRDHLGRRERVVDRGRGRAVLAPGRGRGGGDRRARREVGRDGEGARRARRRAQRSPRPSSSSTAAARLAHYKCPTSRRVPRRAGPHRHRQAPEVQAARALLGRPHAARQLVE